jgi:hypothetical protein
MKNLLARDVTRANQRLIRLGPEVGTMLTINKYDTEDQSTVIELEENGIMFRLESDSLNTIYGDEGILFMLESPSFLNISETVSADPVELRSMRELYDRLLSLAQKGDL